MRHPLRFMLLMLIALILCLGATGGVSAQDGIPWDLDVPDPSAVGAQGEDEGEGAGGTVQKTFELTLTGDVPEGELAIVFYGTTDLDEPGDVIVFCGPEEFADEPCEAGTYTSAPITLAAGTTVSFVYAAGDPEADEPRFAEEGTETLTESMVNRQTFHYGGDDQQDDTQAGGDKQGGGDDKQDTDDGLPVTGGAMPIGVPVGYAATLALLLAGGYAVSRRR